MRIPLTDPIDAPNPAFATLFPNLAVIGSDGRFVVGWRENGLAYGRRFTRAY